MAASYVSMIQQNPVAWKKSDEVSLFFEKLSAASYSSLMLDYDGTLAPFTERRLEAVPYPGVRERLQTLLSLEQNRVVLISGRKAHELQSLIALHRPIEIWGSHGREHLDLDGRYSIEPLTEQEQNALDRIRQELERHYEPAMLESKPNSIAVHWRGIESYRADIERNVQSIFATYRPSRQSENTLKLLSFDGGLEVRAGDVNKGDAVRKLLAGLLDNTAIAFLGDDTTDEDAFQVLAHHRPGTEVLTMLVRAEARASFAQAWLQPPADLLEFLDRWIQARETFAIASKTADEVNRS
jgi:trehalose-phosphatase